MRRRDAFPDTRFPATLLLLSAVATFSLAVACTFIKKITPGLSAEPTHSVRSIEIRAINANQNTAVRVDVVFVFDEQLVDELLALTARAWFRQRKTEYLARYGQVLIVRDYEFVPIDQARLDVREVETAESVATKARAVILFADYQSESAIYTLDISEFVSPIVRLEEATVSIRES
jgi:hypothetical protein